MVPLSLLEGGKACWYCIASDNVTHGEASKYSKVNIYNGHVDNLRSFLV